MSSRAEKDLTKILSLVVELRHLISDASSAGAWVPKVENGRGMPLSNPTETLVFSPTAAQIRKKVGAASDDIQEAREILEDVAVMLANGFLRLDRQEWIRAQEKRQAALGR